MCRAPRLCVRVRGAVVAHQDQHAALIAAPLFYDGVPLSITHLASPYYLHRALPWHGLHDPFIKYKVSAFELTLLRVKSLQVAVDAAFELKEGWAVFPQHLSHRNTCLFAADSPSAVHKHGLLATDQFRATVSKPIFKLAVLPSAWVDGSLKMAHIVLVRVSHIYHSGLLWGLVGDFVVELLGAEVCCRGIGGVARRPRFASYQVSRFLDQYPVERM
mmetsp:Transcript_13743/g.24526  ORF Transcript_13743/g.24526 Transcript_13743/m.24526 type:complete len:217 (+) Transcript_13743:117-767(+)